VSIYYVHHWGGKGEQLTFGWGVLEHVLSSDNINYPIDKEADTTLTKRSLMPAGVGGGAEEALVDVEYCIGKVIEGCSLMQWRADVIKYRSLTMEPLDKDGSNSGQANRWVTNLARRCGMYRKVMVCTGKV